VRLRPWEQRDADCARQGRACSEHDAREWIERQRQRSAAGEGLSLAIVDDGTDAALGYVGLLFRPRLESGIVRREAAVDLPGLVFNLQPGNVGIGYWSSNPHAAADWHRPRSCCSHAGRSGTPASSGSRR
jgi:hypothetical protein